MSARPEDVRLAVATEAHADAYWAFADARDAHRPNSPEWKRAKVRLDEACAELRAAGDVWEPVR